MTIKVIDKSIGLIVTENHFFLSNYSFENEDGTLQKPYAWVVCERYGTWVGVEKPDKIMGAWNVRVKSDGKVSTAFKLVFINFGERVVLI